jgi:Domain of unknown function (DUF4124)
MGNAAITVGIAVALAVSSGAASAAYKCKDANGKISYSEQPCQGAATQTKIKTDADARQDFVRQLQALAKLDAMWDVPTVEKTLGVRLAEASGSQQGVNVYSIATTTAGAPIVGSRIMLPTGENTYTGGSMELRLDPKRCVSPEMMQQIFGQGTDLNPEHSFNYVVNAGGYRTEISGGYRSEVNYVRGGVHTSPRCAEFMTMMRQVSTQPRSSGSRRR